MKLPSKWNLVRHLCAIGLFCGSWYLLKQWYLFQHTNTLIGFWLLFSAAIITALAGQLNKLNTIAPLRLVGAAFLILLVLPWGEWLRLSTMTSRDEWTLQIFTNATFTYGALILLNLIPAIASFFEGLLRRFAELFERHPALLRVPPVLFFCFTAWIAIWVHDQTPVVQDSSAHLFQAKIFKAGKLFAPAPPAPESFNLTGDMLVIHNGKWFGMYQPGFAALLALAMFVRAEWLVSPLLGALTIAIWISYIKRWHNVSTAAVFSLIAILSPFLFLMSSTVMVFAPELFVASSIIYLCRMQTEKESLSNVILIFGLLVYGILVRSFSLLPFLFPVLLYTFWNSLKTRSIKTIAAMALGGAAGFAILFWYQIQTTGDPLLPGYLLEYPDVGYGFGQHFAGTHTPLKSLENISNSLLGINNWANGWYSGSLFFVILFVLFAPKFGKWDIILLLCCAGLALFYFFFLFQDLFFGPRYYYCFAPITLLLIARIAASPTRLGSLIPALVMISLICFIPERLSEFVNKYDLSSTNAGYLKKEILANGQTKRLVFLDKNIQNYFVNWNNPFLKMPIIIARDLGAENINAINAFPDHRPSYYRLEISYDKKKLKAEYKIFDQPSTRPPGYVSLFELGMALEMSRDYWTRDSFDIAFTDFFNPEETVEQLEFLDEEATKLNASQEYRNSFKKGLIHSGRMLLIPKLAFDKKGLDWRSEFSIEQFRTEFQLANDELKNAGEIGKEIIQQLDKIKRRIDKDNNLAMSDAEICNYLEEKLRIFIMGG